MTKDMTQGSPLKLILAFAVPLMLGSLFQQFYNLADTIVVGQMCIRDRCKPVWLLSCLAGYGFPLLSQR